MTGKIVTAYIALGSNIGNREENLNNAIEMLKQNEGVEVKLVSTYINTAPVGFTEKPHFLNAGVEVKTSLYPHKLLEICSDIEKKLKRERSIHWGPRTIDLDILLYEDLVLNDADLIIPHPRMHEREFVLKPLKEIAPKALHPVLKKTIEDI